MTSALSSLQLDRLQESVRVPAVLGGRYRIESVLGRGGMGVVYLAEDSRLQRKVAVKVIDPALASADLESRLEREARLLGRLSHPGIVPIYDLGREDELTLFYVMKHVDGETLEQWLPKHPSRAERLRLFLKLCDPVAFAHAQGIVHRDLKPSNVMIGAFGEALIMDWGLAVAADEPGEDILALGALLKYLLEGEAADKQLNAICMRAMNPERSQRYAFVRELEADVLRYLDGEAVLAYQESWHEKGLRWARRHQLALSLVAVYLLMRVIVAMIR